MTTVLLVESDRAALRALRHLLEGAGYRVCAAAHEEEARRVAREETCALAVIDLSAPGVPGIAICRSLCEGSVTAVLALSAGTVPDERTAALAAGARDYLVKPVPAQRLLQSLAALAKK
jgi:DNA-binding response OmpR family regulator